MTNKLFQQSNTFTQNKPFEETKLDKYAYLLLDMRKIGNAYVLYVLPAKKMVHACLVQVSDSGGRLLSYDREIWSTKIYTTKPARFLKTLLGHLRSVHDLSNPAILCYHYGGMFYNNQVNILPHTSLH